MKSSSSDLINSLRQLLKFTLGIRTEVDIWHKKTTKTNKEFHLETTSPDIFLELLGSSQWNVKPDEEECVNAVRSIGDGLEEKFLLNDLS